MKWTPAQEEQLQAAIEALGSATLHQLRSRWLVVFGCAAPPTFKRAMLVRAISWKMQVNVHGDISPATLKHFRKITEDLRQQRLAKLARKRGTPISRKRLPTAITPGTRLVRTWKGTTHLVEVTSEGFEWHGQTFKSLTRVAQSITGTKWNGPLFFGLREGRSESEKAGPQQDNDYGGPLMSGVAAQL